MTTPSPPPPPDAPRPATNGIEHTDSADHRTNKVLRIAVRVVAGVCFIVTAIASTTAAFVFAGIAAVAWRAATHPKTIAAIRSRL